MALSLAALDVNALFCDRGMFSSRRAWEASGFTLVNRTSNGKITVAQHASVPGVLFKKYTDDVDEDVQTKNFERRTDGSRRLRAFITERGLSHVAVPEKQILELPKSFSHHDRVHILAVERLDVLDENSTNGSLVGAFAGETSPQYVRLLIPRHDIPVGFACVRRSRANANAHVPTDDGIFARVRRSLAGALPLQEVTVYLPVIDSEARAVAIDSVLAAGGARTPEADAVIGNVLEGRKGLVLEAYVAAVIQHAERLRTEEDMET